VRRTSRLVDAIAAAMLVVTALGAIRVVIFAATHIPARYAALVAGYDVGPAIVGIGAIASLFMRRDHRAVVASCIGAAVLALYVADAVLAFGPHSDPRHLPPPAGLRGAWDPRSQLNVVLDYRARGVPAYYALTRSDLDAAYRADRTPGHPYPLAGIANAFTVYCNEGGTYATYLSDRHGFNNPAGAWNGQVPDVVLVGDSFAQGACVDTTENIAAQIRHTRSAISLGVNGNGPLSELAILREFAAPLRPHHVVWLYFPGNDFMDLESETARGFLGQYRASGFRQSLLSRQSEVDALMRSHLDHQIATMAAAHQHPWRTRLRRFLTLRDLREKAFPMLVPEWDIGTDVPCAPDRLLRFTDVIAQARSEVEQWGGRFYFANLPPWGEYPGTQTCRPARDTLIQALDRRGISVIDLEPRFGADSDHRFWQPPYRWTHLTPAGYALATRVILERLDQDDGRK
jgi:hypothetical protein